jgi:hypothetical protein
MTTSFVELLIANRQGVCVALLAVAIGFLLPATMAGQTPDRQSDAGNIDAAKSPDATAQQPPYAEQKPQYPGAPPTKGKLEGTMGPLKLRFYGTLLQNISVSDSAEVKCGREPGIITYYRRLLEAQGIAVPNLPSISAA